MTLLRWRAAVAASVLAGLALAGCGLPPSAQGPAPPHRFGATQYTNFQPYQQLHAAALAGMCQLADTVADVRTVSGPAVLASGQPAPCIDVQGAEYDWSTSSTASDNGRTVIAPTGVATGRWLLATGNITSFDSRYGEVTLESADVTGALGFTPPSAPVTNSSLATAPAYTLKGNATGSSATPQDVSVLPSQLGIPGPSVTLSGLEAISATNAATMGTVWRGGYTTIGDAPPLAFVWTNFGSSAPTVDNEGYIVAPGGAGSCPQIGGNYWCWKAVYQTEGIDWRQFGVATAASDNHAATQTALNTGFTLALPARFCGAGSYAITATVYFYSTPVVWCSHSTVVKKTTAGPAMVLVDAIGNTYPHNAVNSMRLVQPTIDMDFQAGAGIVFTGVNGFKIEDPVVFDIGTGSWSWTDAAGTGTVDKSAGIAALAGGPQNDENGKIQGGWVGNYAWGASGPNSYSKCAPTEGDTGLYGGIPSQDMGNSSPNPFNGNTIENTLFDCDGIGVYDPYGSQNRYVNIDTTFSGQYGIALGTVGRMDLLVGGTCASGDTLSVFFGSPNLGSYSGTAIAYTMGSSSCPTEAAGLASLITTDLSAYGIKAGVWSGTGTIHLDYGDQFGGTTDQQLNLGIASTGSGLTFGGYHSGGWNEITQTSGEDIGTVAAQGTGSISGTTLTISACTACTFGVGQVIVGGSVSSNNVAGNTYIISLGTGTGGTGTYNLSVSQTVGSETMIANNGAWLYIGGNEADLEYDMPAQLTGTPRLVQAWHGGTPGIGAANIWPKNNRGQSALPPGTALTASEHVDCLNDPQPYLVTLSSAVTVTMNNVLIQGEECRFTDTNGTITGTNTIGFTGPTGNFGDLLVLGSGTKTFGSAYFFGTSAPGPLNLMLYQATAGTSQTWNAIPAAQ